MNKIDFAEDAYKELCDRMKELMTQEAELNLEKEQVRKALISLAGGERMENGIKLSYVEPSPSVDYKSVVASLGVPDGILDMHMKDRGGYWKITKY